MGSYCKGCKFYGVCGDPKRKHSCPGYEIGNKSISSKESKVKGYCKGCKFNPVCGDPDRVHPCVGHEFGTTPPKSKKKVK